MTARPQPRHIRIVIDAYPRNALGIIPRRSFKAAGALIGWCVTTGVDTAVHRPWITPGEQLHRILQRPIQKGTTLQRKHGHHGRRKVFGRRLESYLHS